jgi:hypothetical protein
MRYDCVKTQGCQYLDHKTSYLLDKNCLQNRSHWILSYVKKSFRQNDLPKSDAIFQSYWFSLCGLGHIQLSFILNNRINITGAHGNVVVEALCCKPEGHGFHSWWHLWFFFQIDVILRATLGPGVYSAFNRNEYEKQQKKKMFLGCKAGPVRKADSFTAICELIVWTMWNPQHLAAL